MRWHQLKLVCSFLTVLGAFNKCTQVNALNQVADNAGCMFVKSQRIIELEKKISVIRKTLQTVMDRTAQVKREREWQATQTELVQTDDDAHPRVTVTEMRSRRDSQIECANMRDRISLVNGTRNSGRLEVLVGRQWSPVREDGFGKTEAAIVCTALGFDGNHAWPLGHEIFGDGADNFLVDESCRKSVGIMCGTGNVQQIRLVNGSLTHQGQVEVEIADQWGTICHHNWNQKTANMTCRMLGYNYEFGALAVGGSFFGAGEGPVWFNGFDCRGNEADLMACSTDTVLPSRNCDPNAHAGVICDNWIDYPVRLMDGPIPGQGRVEVEILGQWGTISSNLWDDKDARVVCRMLGYNVTNARATRGAVFGRGSDSMPVWLDNVGCNGTERHLLQCFNSHPLNYYPNNHNTDAGVLCAGNYTDHVSVRLVNGSNSDEGRVEVQFGAAATWGTICDDSWDVLDAQVICRQLGKNSTSAKAWSDAHFGYGELPMIMDDVNCVGTEDNVAECGFPGVGIQNCEPDETAGVTCG